MRYIITENQQQRMRKMILELLENEFAESNVVCEIKVYDVDEEEKDYEVERGLKYDIFVYLNEKFTRAGGIYGFTVATDKKINKILSGWLGLSENEYYVSILVKDC